MQSNQTFIKIEYNNSRFYYKELIPTLQSLKSFIKSRFSDLPNHYDIVYTDENNKEITIGCDEDLQLFKKQARIQKLIITSDNMKDDELDELAHLVDRVRTSDTSVNEQEVLKQLQRLSLDSQRTDVSKRNQVLAKRKEKLRKLITELLPEISALVQRFGKSEEQPIHENVRCDGCSTIPIVGIRYKCRKCKNFDFCEKCEDNKPHKHPFIKIRNPEQAKHAYSPRFRSSSSDEYSVQEPKNEKKWRKSPECQREVNERVKDERINFNNNYFQYPTYEVPQSHQSFGTCLLQMPQGGDMFSRFIYNRESQENELYMDQDEKVEIISQQIRCNKEYIRSICSLYRQLSISEIVDIIKSDDIYGKP